MKPKKVSEFPLKEKLDGKGYIQIQEGNQNKRLPEQLILNELEDKVQKVPGKQLSDENFTAEEKRKLAGLQPGDGGVVSGGIADAPADGSQYTRGGGKWNKLTVDKELNEVSPNPVANSAVTAKLRTLEGKIGKAVDHGVGDTTFELTPNDLHVWGEVASLNLTLQAPTENKEYKFQFSSGTQPTTLSLPSEIKWIGNDSIEANKTYQVSILNNLAVRGGM